MKLFDLLFEIGEVKNPYPHSFIKIQENSSAPFKGISFPEAKFKKLIYDIHVGDNPNSTVKLNVSIDFIEDDGSGFGELDGLIFVTFSDESAKDPFATLNLGLKSALRIMSTMMIIIKNAIYRLEMKGHKILGIGYHPAGSKNISKDAKGNIRKKSSGSQQRDTFYNEFLRKSFNVSRIDSQTLPEFKIYWIKK